MPPCSCCCDCERRRLLLLLQLLLPRLRLVIRGGRYDNASIVHLLCKYGACINYEDCVNNAAALVLQTLWRHHSWRRHRPPWTTQNGPRYRLQETMTWRRLGGLYVVGALLWDATVAVVAESEVLSSAGGG